MRRRSEQGETREAMQNFCMWRLWIAKSSHQHQLEHKRMKMNEKSEEIIAQRIKKFMTISLSCKLQ